MSNLTLTNDHSTVAPAVTDQTSNPLYRFVLRMAKARRDRRDRELLSQMDDHQLADIGVTRSDIERVIRLGR